MPIHPHKIEHYIGLKAIGRESFPKDAEMTKRQQSDLIKLVFGIIPSYSGKTRTFYIN